MTRTKKPIPAGTIVNDPISRVRFMKAKAYMIADCGGIVQIYGDAGQGVAARYEVRVPRIPHEHFVPMRLRLAYGAWIEAGGSKVLFSRDYCPLWRIFADGRIEDVEPWRHINFVEQAFFWNGSTAPWHHPRDLAKAEARLEDFGITNLPLLADALGVMIATGRNEVSEAVHAMARAAAGHAD
jgi:hypothetical protein